MLINNFTEKDVVIEQTNKPKEILKAHERIYYDDFGEMIFKIYLNENHTFKKKKSDAVASLELQAKLNLRLLANKDTIVNLYRITDNVVEYTINSVDAKIVNSDFANKTFSLDINEIDSLIEEKVRYDKKQSYKSDLFFVAFESFISGFGVFKLLSFLDVLSVASMLVSLIFLFAFVLSINIILTYFQNKRKKQEIQKDIIYICSPDVLEKLFSKPKKTRKARKKDRGRLA
ncbi:MAG: hypothetical protein IJZ57_06930 [Clostridia bacterium]|nr:hypothetical protein [Clostridia bacterium]